MISYNHRATKKFWSNYNKLPKHIQVIADKQYQLLKNNPLHPSLHLKKVEDYYSVRITDDYRALAIKKGKDFVWLWIGNHSGYDKNK